MFNLILSRRNREIGKGYKFINIEMAYFEKKWYWQQFLFLVLMISRFNCYDNFFCKKIHLEARYKADS